MTYQTLHTASLASRHLSDGLTPDAADKAGRHLLSILGARAVAICDAGGLLGWTGSGEHHGPDAHAHASSTRTSGTTSVIGSDVVTCSDPDCPIRSAVIAPLRACPAPLAAPSSERHRPSHFWP